MARNNKARGISFSIHAQAGLASVMEVPQKKRRSDLPFKSTHEYWAARGVLMKRFDLLIADANQYPVVAIEYQGVGHHVGETAYARDEIKRLACRKSNIPLLVINAGERPDSYSARVSEALESHLAFLERRDKTIHQKSSS